MHRLPSVTVGLCTTALLLGSPAIAQVTDDGTAGTIVDDFGDYIITGGTQELTTLFHSFVDFSPDAAVYFELDGSQSDVSLVLGRVTGNNPSFIDSELGVSGGNEPDLFLINPNGISFGSGASLDIPGSLMVSTADSVIFADGQSFSSSSLSAPPQLTISTPIGLQFGATAAPITVEDSFLEISEGKSFGFFGGDVHLSGASITAPSGVLSIGSVVPDSQITFTDVTFLADYSNVTNFQDVLLDQGSAIELSGDIGGQVQLQGRMVNIVESTTLAADTYSAGQGGDITITGDVISVSSSELYTTIYGAGRGGNITITSDEISIDNSYIALGTYGSGESGNIVITGDVISISNSNLYAETYGAGQGGDITITGDVVSVNGTDLYADTYGAGQGGDITITGDVVSVNDTDLYVGTDESGQSGDITITGDVVSVNETDLYASTVGDGQGGNITIMGDVVFIESGGLLASTRGAGQGGELTIIADVFTADDFRLSTNTFDGGNAGNIMLQAKTIGLRNDTSISASTFGSGQGGEITIIADVLTAKHSQLLTNTSGVGNAGTITLQTGTIEFKYHTRLSASTSGVGQGGELIITSNVFTADDTLLATSAFDEGDGGSITLQAKFIALQNVAQVTSTTTGNGDGGEVRVTATDSVNIMGNELLGEETLSSGLSASAELGSTGNAGNVNITTPVLNIRDGGIVAASTSGSGNAGNIVIRAEAIAVTEPVISSDAVSGIVALVLPEATGSGGSIDIEADQLQVFNGGQIAASTRGSGNAGTVNIRASEISVSGESELLPSAIAASSFTAATAGSVSLAGDEITIQNGAEVSVNSNGGAGDLNLLADTLYLNNGSLSGNISAGTGGNLNLSANDLLLIRNNSLISTNATDTATGGNIFISAPTIVGIENSDITANAVFGSGGNIDISTDVLAGLAFRNQLTPLNDITASSQFGISGNVAINNFNTDPASDLTALPENLVNANEQVAQHCSAKTGSFTVTGLGGLSPTATHDLNHYSVWQDRRGLSERFSSVTSDAPPSVIKPAEQESLVEASTWTVTASGQLEFTTASATNPNLQTHAVCSGST